MKPGPLADAQRHALAEYPRESCGLVVVVHGKQRYLPCHNLAEGNAHFVLDPHDYDAADAQGEIIALVHSHPDEAARPSEADRVQCEASEIRWVIVSIMPGENGPVAADTFEFEPSGYLAPMVGREWHHGTLDCWALCRDWYARERGIELPNPARPDDWWNDGSSDLYSDNAMAGAGFDRLASADDLEEGDLILMQVRSRNLVPNHAAIYLGDSLMLHHLHGRLSSRDVFGGYWRECARSYWRLKTPG